MRIIIPVFILTMLSSVSNAQWMQTNGPEGIAVNSFLNVSDTVLLCGTEAKGVYLSRNHGTSWIHTVGLDNKWIDCFAMDSQYVYAGCFGEGVFRSSDNGHTWQPANISIENTAVTCMVTGGNYLFAAAVNSGMFRSADHGTTWIDVSQSLLTQSYMPAMVYSNGRLMVEVDNYIYFSTDFGGTWDVDQGATAFYTIDNFFQHGDTVLASDGQILFRTTDGGINWSNPLDVGHALVGFDAVNDTVYAGSYDGMLKSTDYGLSWSFTPSSDLRFGARSLDDFKISGTDFLYAYDEIGVYKSTNQGANWQQVPLSNFQVASNIDDAMIFDNGTIYTGTHTDGVYKSTDQGNTWAKIGTSNNLDTLSNEVVFDMLHVGSNILLAGGCGNGLFRSADNGSTWTHITAGLPPDNGNFTCVKTLAQCGPNILCAMINGVFYSVDSGLTWLPTNLTPTDVLQTAGFAIRDSIACVGVIGDPPFPTGIYRSTNYGVTWSFAEGLLDIEVMAAGGNHTMYAGELFSADVSYDDGLTWFSLPLTAAFTILAWDEYAFIGGNDGLFWSDDYGFSWTQANDGFDPYPNNAVQGLTRDSTYLYAGFYRDGIWRRPLSDFGTTTGIHNAEKKSSAPFTVFPNPVADRLNIKAQSSMLSQIILFAADGRKVLHESFAGRSSINVGFLSAGIYIYEIHDSTGAVCRGRIVKK